MPRVGVLLKADVSYVLLILAASSPFIIWPSSGYSQRALRGALESLLADVALDVHRGLGR